MTYPSYVHPRRRLSRWAVGATTAVLAGAVVSVATTSDRHSSVQATGGLEFAVVNPRAAQEMLDEVNVLSGGATNFSVFDADGMNASDYCFVAYWQRYQSGDAAVPIA